MLRILKFNKSHSKKNKAIESDEINENFILKKNPLFDDMVSYSEPKSNTSSVYNSLSTTNKRWGIVWCFIRLFQTWDNLFFFNHFDCYSYLSDIKLKNIVRHCFQLIIKKIFSLLIFQNRYHSLLEKALIYSINLFSMLWILECR
jgi:hypothetical protein